MYLSVCVLGILSVSVSGILQLPNSRFHYAHSVFRRSEDCNMCYGEECLPVDQPRCAYYREADTVLLKDDEEPAGFLNPQLQNDVDGLIFTMVEKANLVTDMECIPYLSRYTDCTKENVCYGCKTCHCTAEGKWNCNSTSHCRRQEPAIDIDHRVLILAIENMIGTKTKLARKKRSVGNNLQEKVNSSTVTLEQISEWFYGVKPEQREKKNSSPTDGAIVLENANKLLTTTEKRGGRPDIPPLGPLQGQVELLLGPTLDGLDNPYDSDVLFSDQALSNNTKAIEVTETQNDNADIFDAGQSQISEPADENIPPENAEKINWNSWTPADLKTKVATTLSVNRRDTPSTWLHRRRPKISLQDKVLQSKLDLVEIMKKNAETDGKIKEEQLKQEKIKTAILQAELEKDKNTDNKIKNP